MTPKKLAKLRRELARLRGSPRKAAEIEGLARRLGRKQVKRRGKEPMWENEEFPELFVLSIPRHGGKDLAIGTQRSILNQLEEDVRAWEERFDEAQDRDSDYGEESGTDSGSG